MNSEIGRRWANRPDVNDRNSMKRQRLINRLNNITIKPLCGVPNEVADMFTHTNQPNNYGIGVWGYVWARYKTNIYIWSTSESRSYGILSIPISDDNLDGYTIALIPSNNRSNGPRVVCISPRGIIHIWKSISSNALNVNFIGDQIITPIDEMIHCGGENIAIRSKNVVQILEINFETCQAKCFKLDKPQTTHIAATQSILAAVDLSTRTTDASCSILTFNSKRFENKRFSFSSASFGQARILGMSLVVTDSEHLVFLTMDLNRKLKLVFVNNKGNITTSQEIDYAIDTENENIRFGCNLDAASRPWAYVCAESANSSRKYNFYVASMEINFDAHSTWNYISASNTCHGAFHLAGWDDDISRHATLMTTQGVFAIFTESISNFQEDRNVNNTGQQSALDEEQATRAIGRIYRTFVKNGASIAQDDGDWPKLFRTNTAILYDVMTRFIQKETHEFPKPVWADQIGNTWNSNFFSKTLVERHLTTIRENLENFIQAMKLHDFVPDHVMTEYYSMQESMLRLSELHSRHVAKDGLFQVMKEVIQKHGEVCLERLESMSNANNLEDKLRDVGISVPLLFYSQVSLVKYFLLALGTCDTEAIVSLLPRVAYPLQRIEWRDNPEVCSHLVRCAATSRTSRDLEILTVVIVNARSVMSPTGDDDNLNQVMWEDIKPLWDRSSDHTIVEQLSVAYACHLGMITLCEKYRANFIDTLKQYLSKSSGAKFSKETVDASNFTLNHGNCSLGVKRDGDSYYLACASSGISTKWSLVLHKDNLVSLRSETGLYLDWREGFWGLSNQEARVSWRSGENDGLVVISRQHAYLSVSQVNSRECAIESLYLLHRWDAFANTVFRYYNDKGRPEVILELVENGNLDNEVDIFLSNTNQTNLIAYLNALRRKQYRKSVEAYTEIPSAVSMKSGLNYLNAFVDLKLK